MFPIKRASDEGGFEIIIEKDQHRFLRAREGDHLMTTFQCDVCQFRNIKGHSPSNDQSDTRLLTFIRRATLDAFWARETGTVKNTLRDINNIRRNALSMGLKPEDVLPTMGPFLVKDEQGMGLAVCMLLRSLDAGKNERTIQFSTTQKMKSSYANMWRSSIHGNKGAVAVRDTAKLSYSSCPTHGEWFERFTRGMHERLGDKVVQDLGITIDQMKALMDRYDTRWENAEDDRTLQKATLFPALFSIVAFCCALRGEEVPLIRLTDMVAHMDECINHPTHPHVIVVLQGKMKNEVSKNSHVMPIALTTRSGLEPGKWITRMIQWYADEGIYSGWVFRSLRDQEESARASQYENDILGELENIQRELPRVINETINVFEEYGVSRSFRRGSDAHAINQRVRRLDIEINNRWRSIDHAGGKSAKLGMIHHYADLQQLLPTRLIYSSSL